MEIGRFYRVFWKTGGSNDLYEETGETLIRIWTAHHEGLTARESGIFVLLDANGTEIRAHIGQVAAIHLSTPECRAARYERDQAFDVERQTLAVEAPEWL